MTFDEIPAGGSMPGEWVVLLHGLLRTSGSMRRIERGLKKAGYLTLNRGYPSRRKSVERLVDEFLAPLVNEIVSKRGPGRIHFVTHSLGGILVRLYSERFGAEHIGRVVMIAPPNHGSELPDRLKGFAPYRWIFGQAGQELGTAEDDVPAGLSRPKFEFGVIAGTRSAWNPFAWIWLPGDSDGTVMVESTRLDGMADFRKVSAGHTFIMNKCEVIESTIRFLEKGGFE